MKQNKTGEKQRIVIEGELKSLIDRIQVEGDPGLSQYEAVSRIVTRDGRILEMKVDAPKGLGERGLTDGELEAKFKEMVEPRLSREGARRLIDLCWGVDELEDIGALLRATRIER